MDKEVKLLIRHGHRSWTVYTKGDWRYDEPIERVYKFGDKLELYGFYSHQITEITEDHIVIEFNDDKRILTHDKPVTMFTEIEGREWSDGCVYDGDEYFTELTWL